MYDYLRKLVKESYEDPQAPVLRDSAEGLENLLRALPEETVYYATLLIRDPEVSLRQDPILRRTKNFHRSNAEIFLNTGGLSHNINGYVCPRVDYKVVSSVTLDPG
jgi:hypothetical protein